MMRRYTLFLLLLLCAGPLRALEVEGLYEAEIPVTDQGAGQRAQALRTGLEQVLVKVTGYGAVIEEPAVAELLERASRYVQQYRYRQLKQTLPPAETTSLEGVQEEVLHLWMRFDAGALNQQLRSRGLPVWGAARPLVLTWLAVEEGGQRQLVAATDAGLARELVEARAAARGLPLRLPLLDLTDQSQVHPADIWGGFDETILSASERYQPQAILVGRLFPVTGGLWRSRWSLHIGEETMRWETTGTEVERVLGSGVDGAADALSVRFAHVYEAQAGYLLNLRVSEVGDFAAYTRLLEYLDSLDGVSHVHVGRVDGSSVDFQLQLEVAPPNVIRTIGLGSTLAALESPPGQAEAGIVPEQRLYRLLP